MRRFLACGLPLLVLAAGCSGFSHDSTLTIARGESYAEAEFKPAREAQTLAVTVKSPQPVSVFAVLADDKAEAVRCLREGKKPRPLLASDEDTREAALSVKLPAGRSLLLFVVRKDASAELEVTLAAKAK